MSCIRTSIKSAEHLGMVDSITFNPHRKLLKTKNAQLATISIFWIAVVLNLKASNFIRENVSLRKTFGAYYFDFLHFIFSEIYYWCKKISFLYTIDQANLIP